MTQVHEHTVERILGHNRLFGRADRDAFIPSKLEFVSGSDSLPSEVLASATITYSRCLRMPRHKQSMRWLDS